MVGTWLAVVAIAVVSLLVAEVASCIVSEEVFAVLVVESVVLSICSVLEIIVWVLANASVASDVLDVETVLRFVVVLLVISGASVSVV
ncbi:MAG: hypothetical protein PHD23_05240 [Eubacteriales bacterium]|nr:hypothetical protein [Eubacteriales bacterium]